MIIKLTVADVLRNTNNWMGFCDRFGFGEYVVNEGGGDVEVEMTLDEAREFGLLSCVDCSND